MVSPRAVRALLEALTAAAATAALRDESRAADLTWAAVLALAAVTWLEVNGPVEGAILWTVTPDHGLTSADLRALPAAGVFVLLLRHAARR